jgi:tetratricopeptide (TPR) repeat protein
MRPIVLPVAILCAASLSAARAAGASETRSLVADASAAQSTRGAPPPLHGSEKGADRGSGSSTRDTSRGPARELDNPPPSPTPTPNDPGNASSSSGKSNAPARASSAQNAPPQNAGTSSARPSDNSPPHRDSLQEFLARLRAHRDGVMSELKGGVDAILRSMDLEAQSHHTDGLADGKTRLVALGPECAPLLIDQVDPGDKATDAGKLRSAYVTQALVELGPRGITNEIVDIAQKGSPDGRLNAVKILAASPEPDRASPVLVSIFRSSHGDLRAAALAGLARNPGPDSEKVLVEALADSQPEIVALALTAMASAKNASLAPKVSKLAAATHEASAYVEPLVFYYRACPEAVDKPTLTALIRLAGEYSASTENRVHVLELLPTFADRFDAEHKKELKAISESPTRELHEAALVSLYLVGDKSARRELLQDYDVAIERNKTWASSYENRAGMLYRIADYREAIKDYQRALQLSSGDLHAHQEESYIGLARCYAQMGKLKEAAQQIEKAPISMKRLAELAREPVFAKLLESKYKTVFKTE